MGMFDTIAWGEKLPFSQEMEELGLNKNDWDFQTKDLDCVMATYFVQEGKLFLQRHRIQEWIEGDPKAKDLMDRMGYLKQEEPYLEPIQITTTLKMCDLRYNVLDKWDCWIEYEAVFVAGKLESVKLLEFEKKDNAERLALDEEFRQRHERENAMWRNRFLFHTRPWRVISRILRRITIASAELLYKISYKIP